jgi:hypothetical protein
LTAVVCIGEGEEEVGGDVDFVSGDDGRKKKGLKGTLERRGG